MFVLVILAGGAAAAQAGLLTLQNGLDGYTGCEDTFAADRDDYFNHGVAIKYSGTWYHRLRAHLGLGEKRFKAFVRFNDLDTAIPVSGADQIQSAKLYLYKYDTGGSPGNFSAVAAYRSLKPWVEGQGGLGHTDQNWTRDSLSGASNYYWNAARQLYSYTQHSGSVYWTGVPDGITIEHFQFGSAYNFANWHSVASMADVDAAYEWYHDTAADRVYFHTSHSGVFGSAGVSYYVAADRWADTAGTGATDIDTSDPLTGDWPDGTTDGWGYIDITPWVKDWYTNPATNYGVLLTPDDNDIRWYQSEYSDTTLGPYLEIEYEAGGPIPEPASLGLLGAALLAMRKRKRSLFTSLSRRHAMKHVASLCLIVGLLVVLAGSANAVPWELPPHTTLAVDFGPSDDPQTTEAGWVSFACGPHNTWVNGVTYTHAYGVHTVSVSATDTPSGGLQLRAKRESSPTDSGDFTWGDVYNDHVFTYNTMMIKIEGLEASHTYEKLYLLNKGGSGAGRISEMWLSLGSPTTHVFHTIGAADPVTNNDPGSIMELAGPTSTAAGELQISFRTASGSSVSSWTNGFILVDTPPEGPVPEPASLGLLGVALLALRKRR
jgi:hypothetical protein